MVLESVYNSSRVLGSGIRVFRLSFVIILEVLMMAFIGLILLPAKNLAIKNSNNKMPKNDKLIISNKLFNTIFESAKDIATITYPICLLLRYNGT
ncbi:hypothetical protein FLA105534_04893 [Flavobacterium bizetiae]|uniref:Uncharacterized protein n=1 Tax=Flavobacterium bizetiae TaxID=2704140 RepID=A0A6J4H1V0_9FLAO|nr:hypothetical protein FLA105534_04893 [Flavobacterium bizetiae]